MHSGIVESVSSTRIRGIVPEDKTGFFSGYLLDVRVKLTSQTTFIVCFASAVCCVIMPSILIRAAI
jgi:hypothetical protein